MTPDHGDSPLRKNTATEQFDRLYQEQKTAVYRFACYLTQDRNEAEDLFQETWLRVARYYAGGPPVRDNRAWLYTITANLFKDLLRKKKIRRMVFMTRHSNTDEDAELKLNTQTAFHGPDESDQVDMSMAIHSALKVLPHSQRRVFVLKEMEGFKLKEISKILKIPEGTVKSLMFRAVKRLQRELLPYAGPAFQNAENSP